MIPQLSAECQRTVIATWVRPENPRPLPIPRADNRRRCRLDRSAAGE